MRGWHDECEISGPGAWQLAQPDLPPAPAPGPACLSLWVPLTPLPAPPAVPLQVKCDQYWPARGTETYGLIQVTLLDTVELATYTVRTFALYKVQPCPSAWAQPGACEHHGLSVVCWGSGGGWASSVGGVSRPCRPVLWAGWMEAAPEFLQAAPCDF